jgi:putative SOS response-associated peptidase YedK
MAAALAFREAFKSRRCLVLTSGFYEWQPTGGRKQPYMIGMKDRSPFALAGLWES